MGLKSWILTKPEASLEKGAVPSKEEGPPTTPATAKVDSGCIKPGINHSPKLEPAGEGNCLAQEPTCAQSNKLGKIRPRKDWVLEYPLKPKPIGEGSRKPELMCVTEIYPPKPGVAEAELGLESGTLAKAEAAHSPSECEQPSTPTKAKAGLCCCGTRILSTHQSERPLCEGADQSGGSACSITFPRSQTSSGTEL